jgi:hypothetical protein
MRQCSPLDLMTLPSKRTAWIGLVVETGPVVVFRHSTTNPGNGLGAVVTGRGNVCDLPHAARAEAGKRNPAINNHDRCGVTALSISHVQKAHLLMGVGPSVVQRNRAAKPAATAAATAK